MYNSREKSVSPVQIIKKTFFGKVSKMLAEFNKVFKFEKFLIYVQPKFN